MMRIGALVAPRPVVRSIARFASQQQSNLLHSVPGLVITTGVRAPTATGIGSWRQNRRPNPAMQSFDGHRTFGTQIKAQLGISNLSSRDLALVAASTLIPSIAFGFMDNAIMIMAGDQIDEALGVRFGLSTLAAAGLGNLVSDVIGSASEGVIERNVKTPMPVITEQQRQQKPFQYAVSIGKLVGIAIGCLLGMFPLLLRFPDEVQVHVDSVKRAIGLTPISDALSKQLRNRTSRYCGDLRQASGLLGADDSALLIVDTRTKHRQLYTMHHADRSLLAERNEAGCVIGVRPGQTTKATRSHISATDREGGHTGTSVSDNSGNTTTLASETRSPSIEVAEPPLERRAAKRVLLGEVGFAHTLDFDDSEDLPVATTVKSLAQQLRDGAGTRSQSLASGGAAEVQTVRPPVVTSFTALNDLALRTAADGHARQLRLIVGGVGGDELQQEAADGASRVRNWLEKDAPPAWLHPVLVEAACSRLYGNSEPLQSEGVAMLFRPVRDTHGQVLGVIALLESHPYTSSKHSGIRRPGLVAKTHGKMGIRQRTAPWWELDLGGDPNAALEAQRLAVVSTHVSVALDRLNGLKPNKSDVESKPVDLEAALQLVATN